MAVGCKYCRNIGFFKMILTVREGHGIVAYYQFFLPCARCSLPAYGMWLIKNHRKLATLTNDLIRQETFSAS